ncbi:4-(cytidine 5'-diphospho)-2-C-methyl-D-erythritol kinase [Mogibacterium pumilum]|uniref:4-diphosphocytidyl-2-C-methyl-D-erythritol kinase n=1 Tax=Mogibacterium pumilum TaxID=86332 RepID=A0A223AQL4_9FIRM|nr:hypothetical protein [Mogibacterium pumilum]ASS37229.1 hypothetical protein AXF17_01240 [Mogibacterium pumilum]
MNRDAVKSSEIELNAYAKINLSLYVLSRRADGYHDIKSFMQGINIFDTLKIKTKKINNYNYNCFFSETNIYLFSANRNIPLTADNLAVKGAISVVRAISGRYNLTDLMKERGADCISIEIDKKLPVAAGIAGGSGNAAAVMLGVNHLLGNPLSMRELMDVGVKVGADVPFSIMMNTYLNADELEGLPKIEEASSAAIVSGIGEVVEAVEPRPYFVILFNPSIAVSTKEVYEAIDRKLEDTDYAQREVDINLFYNDLELYTLANYEEVQSLVSRIRENLQADEVLMSGSGPTVAAYYTEYTRFEADYKALESARWVEPTWRYWKTKSGGHDVWS